MSEPCDVIRVYAYMYSGIVDRYKFSRIRASAQITGQTWIIQREKSTSARTRLSMEVDLFSNPL